MSPARIRFNSFLSENALDFYRQVVKYLGAQTGLPAVLEPAAAPELAAVLTAGQAEAAFTCGLPYVRLRDTVKAGARLLAAPVQAGERYGGRPIYYSDFIVRNEVNYPTFEALRGSCFAYNEPTSLSGYVLPVQWLLARGEAPDFFGRWVMSGSHAASLDWVESGQADVAAIDSFVLALELCRRPERARRMRVIGSAGPLAMPPVVASGRLPTAVAERLRQALLDMHTTAGGRAALAAAGLERFAPVADEDYDPIRVVWQAVQGSGLAKPN